MLYLVNIRNPYFPKGTYLRKFDDGWEQAVMKQEKGGRASISHYRGIVLPPEVDMTKYAIVITRGYVKPERIHHQRRIQLN